MKTFTLLVQGHLYLNTSQVLEFFDNRHTDNDYFITNVQNLRHFVLLLANLILSISEALDQLCAGAILALPL